MADKVSADAVTHEWQTDALVAAAANAQLEGDQFTFSAPAATARLAATTQIISKTMSVSKTLDKVSKAGRNREFVYQARQRGLECKRDLEFAFFNNQTPVPQASASSTTARAMRPVNSWMSSNVTRGANGGAGTASTAATDGAVEDLTEDHIKTAIRQAWSAGGQPDTIMVGPFNKQRISTFGGNATRWVNADERKLIAGIGFYESDFGIHKIVPNRFSRDRDVWILDMDYWAIATLRELTTIDTAVVADAYNGWVGMEKTLVSRNQQASAAVVDRTSS